MKTHFQKLFHIILFFLKSPKGFYFWGCFCLASSKVLQTIAFFLPIKVLIMLGSEKMPKYLSPFSGYMNYNDVLIFLIAMVPVVYILHLAFGIFFRLLIDKDVVRFKQKDYKVAGYGDINLGKLKRLHNHTSKAFSDIIVFFITSIILLLINPLLTLAIWIVTLLNLSLFVKKAFYVHDDTRITVLKLHKRQFVEYIASSNYLIVFALLVLQMYLAADGIYGAILALLLSRQLFQAVQRFAVENTYISKMI